MAQTANQTGSLTPILLVNFIGSLGYSIVLPFLIVLVLDFGGNELIYGIMGATYSLFQLIGAPILGNWSDKYGRRKILLLSQAGTFVAWVIFLIALNAPQQSIGKANSSLTGAFILTLPLLLLFSARALDGITGGNISVANAYLSDISTESNRKANFGKMSAAGNLGFIIGPALAGLLGATALGYQLPVVAAMLVSLAAIGVIYFQLNERKKCEAPPQVIDQGNTQKLLTQDHKPCYSVANENTHNLKTVLAIPNAILVLAIYFLVFLGFNFFYVAFPVQAVQGLGWSTIEMGIFFSVLSGVMILFQGPILTRLSATCADEPLIIWGGVALALGFACFTSSSLGIIALGTLLFAGGNGIMWPSFLSKMSGLTNSSMQGALQGIASSVGSFASIIGLIAGGVLYGQMGALVFVVPTFIFIAVTLVLLLKKW